MKDANVDPSLGILRYVVKQLVDHPDDVVINHSSAEDSLTYEINVAPGEVGRVIGRQGRTANALRTVAKAVSVHDARKVFVDIVD